MKLSPEKQAIVDLLVEVHKRWAELEEDDFDIAEAVAEKVGRDTDEYFPSNIHVLLANQLKGSSHEPIE